MGEKKRKQKPPEQKNLKTERDGEVEANKTDGGQCVSTKLHKASDGVNKQDIKTERVNLSVDCVFMHTCLNILSVVSERFCFMFTFHFHIYPLGYKFTASG
jgi:hypothetical protein